MSRLTKNYNITFDIYQEGETSDGGGALIPGKALRSEDNKGKLDMLSGSKQILNEKKEIVCDYMLFCDIITIAEKDQVLVSGKYYDVIRIDTLNYGKNPHLEVYLKKQGV